MVKPSVVTNQVKEHASNEVEEHAFVPPVKQSQPAQWEQEPEVCVRHARGQGRVRVRVRVCETCKRTVA